MKLKFISCLFFASLLQIGGISYAQNAPDGLIIPPFKPVPERTPQFQLKDARALYSEADVRLARENIARYSSAKNIRDEIVKKADYWLLLSDKEILTLMPDARVPRGFDLNANGCPVHGDTIFKTHGFYPWIIDPSMPLKVRCPVDSQVFPGNDFVAFYDRGLKDVGTGDYVDNGFGWISPEGERYWFVAHSNQWMWMNHTIPGLLALSRAYLLTGDARYASRAAFMLYRIGQVYPSMDHENQSRYGLMEKMKGVRYAGKILNRIWETYLIRDIAESYDHVWDYIDKDKALQQFTGKTGREIRSFIEANVIEDGLDAIADGRISGNFGMHQNAMLYLHLVRQYSGKDEAIRKMTEEPSKTMAATGLQYALYNQVFRDGMPLESPGYNSLWVKEIVAIADILKKGNNHFFDDPKFKKLFDAPIDIVATGKYTPDWGDGGSVIGGLTARLPETYHIGFNRFKDNRYLNWIDKSGDESFTTFGSLFMNSLPKAPVLEPGRAVAPQPSRLFAGYGLGILNNQTDRTALAFTYGAHYAHYHWDFLNVELFANGQKMMPDLGYPDAMNTYVAPVYTWSFNTISHNTVVIDEKKQNLNLSGKLNGFYQGDFAGVMDASSPAYSQASQYRRNVVMVKADENQSYVVDFFHVTGGKQHDYSLHGPPGKVIVGSSEWSVPAKGTLAGPEVELEEIYDDEQLQKEGSRIGYSRYSGSGFQHLFNIQTRKSGNGLIEYRHQLDESARLRLHSLTNDVDDFFLADAYDKPRARSYLLKYLIARRQAKGNEPLKSTFVSVFEPYKTDNAYVESATLEKLDAGPGHCVLVRRNQQTDIIIHDTTGVAKKLNRFKIETDAQTAVVTVNSSGQLVRIFAHGGSYVKTGTTRHKLSGISGVVESVDAKSGATVVRVTSGSLPKAGLEGRIAHFKNEYRQTEHPLQHAQIKNGRLHIGTMDDILIGKFRLDDPENLQTETLLTFQRHYNGTGLLDSDFKTLGLLKSVQNGKLDLDGPLRRPVQKDEILWISNLHPGDSFEIKPGFSWVKAE